MEGVQTIVPHSPSSDSDPFSGPAEVCRGTRSTALHLHTHAHTHTHTHTYTHTHIRVDITT